MMAHDSQIVRDKENIKLGYGTQTKQRLQSSKNAKCPMFKDMALPVQYYANASKQTTLLNDVDVGPTNIID